MDDNSTNNPQGGTDKKQILDPVVNTKKPQIHQGRKNFTKLKILHFNCQGMASEARLVEFEQALKNVSFDMIGLSETSRNGEGF